MGKALRWSGGFRFLMILLLMGLASEGLCLEKVRVLVLPFTIHAPASQQAQLREKVPEVIKSFLRQEGAEVVTAAPSRSARELVGEAGGIRELGIKQGADYVIWGSLTRIGDRFSLDARMVSSFGSDPPRVFFVEGEGMENLSPTVQRLTRDFARKIFRRERVARIQIQGNRRIEADAIERRIQTRPGDVYLAKSLSEDLKRVYAMGYFDDIRIEAEDRAAGKIITFHVKEKPTVRRIRIRGNRIFNDEEIQEAINIRPGSILNVFQIRNNIQRIESMYKEKNYHNVHVSYDIRTLENNQAALEFTVDEGGKVRIQQIEFQGNRAYSDKQLKKLMKTSEKGFWSWLTSSGELNPQDLEQDLARLTAFYRNNGYIRARVGEPRVEYRQDWIHITIKIDEGRRFKVGDVAVAGDLVLPEETLMEKVQIKDNDYYNQEVVYKDKLRLKELYSDEGYAYAEIFPRMDEKPDQGVVDIRYDIEKNQQVYFEKIIITGNTKTRDKVIRRELKVYEQELYSGKRLKKGIRNLHRLDYFEDIRVQKLKGSSPNKMILKIDVTEKPTGTFSFGGGYSSVEKAFAMASITQRNLFGRGQSLRLKGELGGTTSRYTLSFTEPWLFDIPLSAGFDLYNWELDYDTYDKDSKGGAVRFGYPIYKESTRLYLSYSYDVADIENITEDASQSVWDLEGTNVTSSVTTTVRYDTRDRLFNPTEGADHSVSVEYAGLGGDIAFTKYTGELGQYIPLVWGTVGFLHGRGGYVEEGSDGILPDYERFYLGGMNSLRGFDWREISVLDENGDEIGGNKFVQFNAELLIPLIKDAGLMGVVFFDTGNVFGESDDLDFNALRESAGFGFRWYSPMGPIRIENGYILDPQEGESSGGRWEFTMGHAF